MDPLVITRNVAATKYAYVASATLLFYDIGLTYRQEMQRVWPARATLGKALFFLNRYIPPLMFFLDLNAQFSFNPKPTLCRNLELGSTIMSLFEMTAVKAVLIMRTHALYHHRGLLYGLVGLAVISLANQITTITFVINREVFYPATTIGLAGCLALCTEEFCVTLLIIFWIPFMLFETLIFTLTAWKSYQTYKSGRHTQTRRLVSILLRDGLIYYIVIMAVTTLNFLIWIIHPYAAYLSVSLLRALQPTVCSRLLLNIRGMLQPENTSFASRLDANTPSIAMSTIQFSGGNSREWACDRSEDDH